MLDPGSQNFLPVAGMYVVIACRCPHQTDILQTSTFISLAEIFGGGDSRSEKTLELCRKVQAKTLLCAIKRSRADRSLVMNDFDAVIADNGRQVLFSVDRESFELDVESSRTNMRKAFRSLKAVKRRSNDTQPFGRTKTVGVITHEAMLPLAKKVDVAIRVEGIGIYDGSRPQDVWLNGGTTWADVFKVATKERVMAAFDDEWELGELDDGEELDSDDDGEETVDTD